MVDEDLRDDDVTDDAEHEDKEEVSDEDDDDELEEELLLVQMDPAISSKSLGDLHLMANDTAWILAKLDMSSRR